MPFSDRTRLNQVLLNFLSNALKFSPLHSHIDVELRKAARLTEMPRPVTALEEDKGSLPAATEHGYVRLEFAVTDHGRGISQEDQSKLFRMFVQLDPSDSREHGGSGIGLALCKGVAQAMSGDVAVYSAGQGCGATFSFHVVVPVLRVGA